MKRMTSTVTTKKEHAQGNVWRDNKLYRYIRYAGAIRLIRAVTPEGEQITREHFRKVSA